MKNINFSHLTSVVVLLVCFASTSEAQLSKNAWAFGFGASMPKVSISWENIGGYLSIQRNFTEHAGLRISANYNSLTRGYGEGDAEESKTKSFWSSLDMLYYFTPCNSFSPYGFVGLGFNSFSHDNEQEEAEEDESYFVFQVGLGIGAEIYLSDDWKLKPEIGFYTPGTDYYDGRYGSNGGGIFGTGYDSFIKADIGAVWYFSRGEPSKFCQIYDGLNQEDKFDYDEFERMLEQNIPKEYTTEKVLVKAVPKKNDRMFLLGVGFEFNSSTLTPESYPVLYHASELLKENPNARVEIEGHCDSIGTDKVNQRISQERADVVKNYLVERGVKENQITAVGYGSTQPIADNNTEEGRAINRRIEFRVVE